jgi:4-carboxymuconolactone decarboxylase
MSRLPFSLCETSFHIMTTRLPRLPPEQLSAAQRDLYASIAAGPRASGAFPLIGPDGALEGPFNAMLLQPELGAALQALGSAVRYRTSLSARSREIAILTVARHWDSAFERHAHEAVARTCGMTGAELTALRAGDAAAFTDLRERLVLTVAEALTARGDLTDEEFATARDELGLPALFELTTLVGYYATLALQLRMFRVAAPE